MRTGTARPQRWVLALFIIAVEVAVAIGGAAAHPATVHRSTDAAAAFAPGPKSTASSANWTTFHGSENRSGYSSTGGPGAPNQLWSAYPSREPIRSGPIVDGTDVFVAAGLGTLYALNRTNGSLVWTRSVPGEPTQLDVSDPYLVGGTSAGELFCLSAISGRTVWTLSLGTPIIEGPTVANGTVFVGTGSGTVAAFGLTNGVSIWQTFFTQPIGTGLSWQDGVLYGATYPGEVFALSSSNGHKLWQASDGNDVYATPAVFGTTLVLGDIHGYVTAYGTSNGSQLWRWPAPGNSTGNSSIYATPTLGLGRVFVQDNFGRITALGLTNGSFLWQTPGSYSPYPTVSSPALTPTGLYAFSEGITAIVDISPANGQTLWLAQIEQDYSYASPAVAAGTLYVADDDGFVTAFCACQVWTITGTVTNSSDQPQAGVGVGLLGVMSNVTDSNGSFTLYAENGTYELQVFSQGSNVITVPFTVTGAVSGLRFVLTPLEYYLVSGQLRNLFDGQIIPGANLSASGSFSFYVQLLTGSGGNFSFKAPNGTVVIQVAPSGGYAGATVVIMVSGAGINGLVVTVPPNGLQIAAADPLMLVVWLPVVGVALAVIAVRFWEAGRARVRAGLSPQVLGRFGRFVVMRLLLIPGQVAFIFALVYVFLSVVPDIARGVPVTSLGYLDGYVNFFVPILTGNWGIYTFYLGGSYPIREPLTVFLVAWLPPSVELAAFGLVISAVVAYPLGLISGWRQRTSFDPAVRLGSLAGLLVPSLVVSVAVLFFAFAPFLHQIGDVPWGMTPSTFWFVTHGGVPDWITVVGGTQPTGFPLVDGALHGDWAFEWVVLMKLLLQGIIVAIVFVAIFLRYARAIIAEAAREPHLIAARSRGVPETALLWRHLGRRVWPYYVLVFGLTIPFYIGTQSVVEIVFQDSGVGQILLFGASGLAGNNVFSRVVVLFILVLILLFTLMADITHRYIDPRWRSRTE